MRRKPGPALWGMCLGLVLLGVSEAKEPSSRKNRGRTEATPASKVIIDPDAAARRRARWQQQWMMEEWRSTVRKKPALRADDPSYLPPYSEELDKPAPRRKPAQKPSRTVKGPKEADLSAEDRRKRDERNRAAQRLMQESTRLNQQIKKVK